MHFPNPTDFLAPDGPLDRAARHADEVASRWHAALNPQDRLQLIEAFLLAESMAAHAIAQARAQLPASYHAGLDAQAADEARHVALFASWLPRSLAVSEPRVKARQTTQWLALLLVNELTGYCQFRMLARVLEDGFSRAAIDEISADERVHVERLLHWLEPLGRTRSSQPIADFILRFRRDLPGRMCQFFPRGALEPLRMEMAEVIDQLLRHLPTGGEVEGATSRASVGR